MSCILERKISLSGQSNYEIGDDVLTFWDSDYGRVMPYYGRITEIDEANRVCFVKIDGGGD